jgi:hypothetical protein
MLAIEIAAGILLAVFILTFLQPILKLLSYAVLFSVVLAVITFIVVAVAPAPQLPPELLACPIEQFPCGVAADPLPSPIATFPGRLAGAIGSVGVALVITFIGGRWINRKWRKD